MSQNVFQTSSSISGTTHSTCQPPFYFGGTNAASQSGTANLAGQASRPAFFNLPQLAPSSSGPTHFEIETSNNSGEATSKLAEASKQLAKKKWEAISQGKNTDCLFLVGPDQDSAVVVCASKVDLTVSSPFFEALLTGPYQEKGAAYIKVENVSPKIFVLIMEFAHTFQMTESSLENLEECIEFAQVADMLLIETLREPSKTLIRQHLDVRSVWTTLDKLAPIRMLTSACDEILTTKTEMCLQEPSFLDISKESLEYFLSLESLNIPSELTLVKACIKLAEANSGVNRSIMDAALPLLRLFTLEVDQIQLLSDYFTEEEKNIIGKFIVFKQVSEEPRRLNFTQTRRKIPFGDRIQRPPLAPFGSVVAARQSLF